MQAEALKVFFLQTGHLQEVVEQTYFERLVAVDRHRQADDAPFFP